MIESKTGDLPAEKADALVNTVNCVGHMGAGIARQFKKAWPENFRAYAAACRNGDVQPGRMFVFETRQLAPPRCIINFPTKRHCEAALEWKTSRRASRHSLQSRSPPRTVGAEETARLPRERHGRAAVCGSDRSPGQRQDGVVALVSARCRGRRERHRGDVADAERDPRPGCPGHRAGVGGRPYSPRIQRTRAPSSADAPDPGSSPMCWSRSTAIISRCIARAGSSRGRHCLQHQPPWRRPQKKTRLGAGSLVTAPLKSQDRDDRLNQANHHRSESFMPSRSQLPCTSPCWTLSAVANT